MSALPPEADIRQRIAHVRFVEEKVLESFNAPEAWAAAQHPVP